MCNKAAVNFVLQLFYNVKIHFFPKGFIFQFEKKLYVLKLSLDLRRMKVEIKRLILLHDRIAYESMLSSVSPCAKNGCLKPSCCAMHVKWETPQKFTARKLWGKIHSTIIIMGKKHCTIMWENTLHNYGKIHCTFIGKYTAHL